MEMTVAHLIALYVPLFFSYTLYTLQCILSGLVLFNGVVSVEILHLQTIYFFTLVYICLYIYVYMCVSWSLQHSKNLH